MYSIDRALIGGAFVPTTGSALDIVNPATERVIGTVRLASVADARAAVAAANTAQATFGQSTKDERIAMLNRLHDAVLQHSDEIRDALIEEYGGPVSRARWVAAYSAQAFLDAADVLRGFELERTVGTSTVVMQPIGVAALFAPWNSAAGTLASKLAMSIAAGNAAILKPSEFSALQSDVMAQAFYDAGLPAGVVNVVTGRGNDVGAELSTNPGVARISFTGSTNVGKIINRAATDTMKRVHLALSGKSPTIILDDADLDTAVPLALDAIFFNNGQACVAGSRLLVPESRLPDVITRIRAHVATVMVGDPRNEDVAIGPLASRRQLDRVQSLIADAIAAGATVITGGTGKPDGLEVGYFVRPTVLGDVEPDDLIVQEEIFGPVLVVLTYTDDDDAVAIANRTDYGLQAYVFGPAEHATALGRRIDAGRVMINTLQSDPIAPFGGFKQSGLGREFGVIGLEQSLEPKALIAGVTRSEPSVASHAAQRPGRR